MYSVKKRFRQLIRRNLEKRFHDEGFLYDGFDTLVGVVFRTKRINDFFLSVAYVTRRWEDDLFTCEYCLSRTCVHNLRLKDMPSDNMPRIGELITQEEKEAMFPQRFAAARIVDPWWQVKGEDDFIDNINKNVDFVIRCAERCDTLARRKALLASKDLENRVALLKLIFKNTTELQNSSPITDQEILRRLHKHEGLLDIGESLQHLSERDGVNLSKGEFLLLVEDCYKTYRVQYPQLKAR